MENERENIIAKIAGLLALADPARNSNENERCAAGNMARRLMILWRVDESEIRARKNEEAEVTTEIIPGREVWETELMTAIIGFTGGQVVRNGAGVRMFLGWPETVEAARDLFLRLRAKILNRAKADARHVSSYGCGFAFGLAVMIVEAKRAVQAEQKYELDIKKEEDACDARTSGKKFRVRAKNLCREDFMAGLAGGRTAELNERRLAVNA